MTMPFYWSPKPICRSRNWAAMRRLPNPGKPRRMSKLRAWLAGIALGLAGCSSTQHAATTLGDPLLGPAPPPAQTTSPLQATTPQNNGLAPIPQSAGLNTNAALASQTPQPHPLGITQGAGWDRKVDGAPTPGMPVSQPRVEPVPKDTSITAPSSPAITQTAWTPAASQPAPTADELEKQLQSRGVTKHDQVPDGNGIRLTVVVQNPANPTAVDTLYTTAPDYPTAVAAIIHEIDAKRAHQ